MSSYEKITHYNKLIVWQGCCRPQYTEINIAYVFTEWKSSHGGRDKSPVINNPSEYSLKPALEM